jgi:hypothetical protein
MSDESRCLREEKESKDMKQSSLFKSLLAGVILFLATSAFAMNNVTKGSFEVFDPSTVGGHQLAPGQYNLSCGRNSL